MTLPLSAVATSIEETMLLSMDAIRRRLEGKGWSIREGAPPGDVPDEELAVWFMPTNTDLSDAGSRNFGFDNFQTTWLITIVARVDNDDKWEVTQRPLIRAVGAVLEALSCDTDDVGLDQSVNFTDALGASYQGFIVDDKRFASAELTLRANHPFFPTRGPPTP